MASVYFRAVRGTKNHSFPLKIMTDVGKEFCSSESFCFLGSDILKRKPMIISE